MGDNVKRIEEDAFDDCRALRFIRLSRTLEYIGPGAFIFCRSLEALFLRSTVKEIGDEAFNECWSLRLLILPHGIDCNNVGEAIIDSTAICRIARNAGVAYEDYEDNDLNYALAHESSRRVNEWLIHHMDEAPFHKLCCDSSVTAEHIDEYLIENGVDSALAIDPYHAMTPLHILSMTPDAPVDAIIALLKANITAVNVRDRKGKTPLYYVLQYNPWAFVKIYSYLCEHHGIENEILSFLLVIPGDDYYEHPVAYYGDDDEGDADDTQLHVLAKNPFAPANAMAVLLKLKLEAAFYQDNGAGMSPLDYGREFNVNGLLAMILVLCSHRNSVVLNDGGD